MAVCAPRTQQYLCSTGLSAFVPTNVMSETKRRTPVSGNTSQEPQRTDGDSTLDSFETVMKAMDAELSRTRHTQTSEAKQNTAKDKGIGKEKVHGDMVDIEAAMEAELRSALEQEEDQSGEEEDGELHGDYKLIKNFLESFKSQAGSSGPVGTLAGRLQKGWMLPRDET